MTTIHLVQCRSSLRRVAVATAAIAFGLAGLGFAQEAAAQEPFYKGKKVEWLVPASPGGGTDNSVRMIAPFLHKHLAGSPTVQVFNEPAGSAVLGMNAFMKAPADGTNIVMTSTSSLLPYLLKESGVQYEIKDLEAIAVMPLGGLVYAGGKTPYKTAADLVNANKQIIFGGDTAVGGETSALLSFEVLGLDTKAVLGYDGSDAARVALEQGEIEVAYDTAPSYLAEVKELEEQGKLKSLYTFGFMQGGKVVRDPLLPNLPYVAEVYREKFGKDPSGDAWNAYLAMFPVRFVLNKVVWVHKDTPEPAKAALRDAFDAIVKDPEFISRKDGALGPYPILLRDDAVTATTALANTDPAAMEWLKKWLTSKFDAKF